MRNLSIKKFIPLLFMAVMASTSIFQGEARKIGYRMKASETKKESVESRMAKGAFMVTPNDTTGPYRIQQIIFTGYDKPQNSSKESFFIINKTDRTLSGIVLNIDYITPDGRQLHKRIEKIPCHIPPGETRKTDISSWDTQHSFRYIESKGRPEANPYTVSFSPTLIYLRY